MPVGNETTQPNSATYLIRAFHTSDTNDEYPIEITIDDRRATTPSDTLKATIAQSLIDLLEDAPNFTVGYGSVKEQVVRHEFTPTP